MPEFTDVVENSGFCERRALTLQVFEGWSAETEIANTLSSFALCAMALWGLRHAAPREHVTESATLCYYLLLCNGLASAAYHFTGYFGFGLLDSFCMTLMATLALASIAHRSLAERPRTRVFAAGTMVMLGVTAMVLDATSRSPYPFRVALAAMFTLFLLAGVFSIATMPHPSAYFRGLLSTVVGFCAWTLDAAFCDERDWWAYLGAHSLWHVLAGHAVLCFTVALFTALDRRRAPEKYTLDWRPCHRYNPFRYVLPLPTLS